MFEIRHDAVLSQNRTDFKSFANASQCIAVSIFIAAGKTGDSPIQCQTSNDAIKAFCETSENVRNTFFEHSMNFHVVKKNCSSLLRNCGCFISKCRLSL